MVYLGYQKKRQKRKQNNMKIGKYEFINEEAVDTKVKALGVEVDEDGNEYRTHSHCIVKLGYVILEKGEYDEDMNVIKEPVLSDKYHVDVLWDGLESHPYGWKSYAVTPSENFLHSFWNVDYLENKI